MINKITINDLESFNKLGLLVNEKFTKLFNLEEIIINDLEYIFGYYLDNDLVGFIHISKIFETIDIINIVVDEKYRNKKIASQLLEYIINHFKDINKILLEVSDNNIPAINLYKKYNFEVINIRKKYYKNSNALIMKRDVKNERC